MARAIEYGRQCSPAAVHRAHDRLALHRHAIERHREQGLPRDVVELLDGDAVGSWLDQEQRHAIGTGAGPRGYQQLTCDVGIGDEDLHPVESVVAARVRCRR